MGQCRLGLHRRIPMSRPLVGHRIVTPPAFQLLKFNSLETRERRPNESAAPRTRQGDGSLDIEGFSTQAFNSMIGARERSALRPLRKRNAEPRGFALAAQYVSTLSLGPIIAGGRRSNYSKIEVTPPEVTPPICCHLSTSEMSRRSMTKC